MLCSVNSMGSLIFGRRDVLFCWHVPQMLIDDHSLISLSEVLRYPPALIMSSVPLLVLVTLDQVEYRIRRNYRVLPCELLGMQ